MTPQALEEGLAGPSLESDEELCQLCQQLFRGEKHVSDSRVDIESDPGSDEWSDDLSDNEPDDEPGDEPGDELGDEPGDETADETAEETAEEVVEDEEFDSDSDEEGGRIGWYKHHGITKLMLPEQDSCKLCRILRRALQAPKHREFVQLAESTVAKNGDEDVGEVEIEGPSKDAAYHLLFWYRVRNPSLTKAKLLRIGLVPVGRKSWGLDDGTNPSPTLSCTSPIQSCNTSSDPTFETVSGWLKICTATHAACRQTPSPSRLLPTRLIEISENKLTLRNSQSLPSTTQYVTLSHCWGELNIIKLTKASNWTFSNVSIPLQELPLTFQHAVLVTTKLGLRHLWIDSLCIIQDSYDDWLQESSQMWQVYSNAHLNIAATASSDGRGGLFRTRPTSSTSPCTITTTWDGLQNGHYYCSFVDEWEHEIIDAPLNQRGWVVQERLLAPRVLHFGSYQLYWECKELLASETYPDGLPKAMFGTDTKRSWDFLRAGPTDDRSAGVYDAWKLCVRDYSRCKLTNASDKLVAVSGVARIIHQRLGGQDTYLAGLWKSKLARLLLWYVGSDLGPCPRATPDRAPTWSWACLDRQIYLYSEDAGAERPWVVTILEANVIPAGDPQSASPFGPVLGGRVRLRAPLFRVALEVQRFTDEQIGTDMVLSAIAPTRYSTVVHYDEGIGPHTNLDRDFHCLIFNSYVYAEKSWVVGLLLEPTRQVREREPPTSSETQTETESRGEFKRFGTFAVSGEKFYNTVIGNKELVDPELQFEEDNGGGDRTVTII